MKGMSTKKTKLKEMVDQFVSDRKNDEWKMADQGRHCAQSASLGDYEASADPPELAHQEFEDVKGRAVVINLSYRYNGESKTKGRLYFCLLFFCGLQAWFIIPRLDKCPSHHMVFHVPPSLMRKGSLKD